MARAPKSTPKVGKGNFISEPKPIPEGAQIAHFAMPTFHASSIQLISAGNDFSLMFMRNAIGTLTLPEGPTTVAQAVPVAEIVLSPGTLKDFALMLGKAISDYEADFGVVETPYVRKVEASKKS